MSPAINSTIDMAPLIVTLKEIARLELIFLILYARSIHIERMRYSYESR